MKIVKKLLSGFVAAAFMCSSGVISVNATNDDPCDLNNDGTVNVRDMALLNRYLNGNLSRIKYNEFDLNSSLTVDNLDLEYLNAQINNTYYSYSYYSKESGTAVSGPDLSNSPYGVKLNLAAYQFAPVEREYLSYDYLHNTERSYTLACPTADSSVETSGIIDIDNRTLTTGSELSGIVRLEGKKPGTNITYYGTGFVVGDHEIATAASNLYDPVQDNWYTNMTVDTYSYSTIHNLRGKEKCTNQRAKL